MRELGEVRVFVDHLGVDARFRRRGVGTELMGAVERWARSHGATSVGLDTYVESPLSVPFYQAAQLPAGLVAVREASRGIARPRAHAIVSSCPQSRRQLVAVRPRASPRGLSQ